MPRNENMKNDIVKLIQTFDSYLDDMYDRGVFDPTNEEDKKIDEMIKTMKHKYY